MSKTSIQWTDFSINPLRAKLVQGDVVGDGHYCEKVSPGCKNCYSSRTQPRFRMPQFQEQRRAGVEHYLDTGKLAQVLRRKKPTKYFWCDMTDMFGHWVLSDWIATCFSVMAATPWHTHQVLTKRVDRMRDVLAWLGANDAENLRLEGEQLAGRMQWCHANEDEWQWPLPNVWIGVSAEDQQRADKRIPVLLQCPASVRFVSVEPLLGPINLRRLQYADEHELDALTGRDMVTCQAVAVRPTQGAKLDWCIVGGESGPGARPCDVQWIRWIVSQCRVAGVHCFVKQLGSVAFDSCESDRQTDEPHPKGAADDPSCRLVLADRKGGDMSEWPSGLRVRQFPEART